MLYKLIATVQLSFYWHQADLLSHSGEKQAFESYTTNAKRFDHQEGWTHSRIPQICESESPRYTAETLNEHNTPNHHQIHTNKARTIMHKACKEQKDSSGLGNSPSSITKQCRPRTSPNISSSLLLQEPPTLIRRLVIRTIMELTTQPTDRSWCSLSWW